MRHRVRWILVGGAFISTALGAGAGGFALGRQHRASKYLSPASPSPISSTSSNSELSTCLSAKNTLRAMLIDARDEAASLAGGLSSAPKKLRQAAAAITIDQVRLESTEVPETLFLGKALLREALRKEVDWLQDGAAALDLKSQSRAADALTEKEESDRLLEEVSTELAEAPCT